jgi:hypothetical protein
LVLDDDSFGNCIWEGEIEGIQRQESARSCIDPTLGDDGCNVCRIEM